MATERPTVLKWAGEKSQGLRQDLTIMGKEYLAAVRRCQEGVTAHFSWIDKCGEEKKNKPICPRHFVRAEVRAVHGHRPL